MKKFFAWILFVCLLGAPFGNLTADVSTAMAPGVSQQNCQLKIAGQIPFLLPTRSSLAKSKERVAAAYNGILEEAAKFLVRSSLESAIKAEDPFAIQGEGRLWPATFEALRSIQDFVESHPKSADLRRILLRELIDHVEEGKKSTRKRVRKRKKSGKADPLSLRAVLKHAPESAMGIAVSPDGEKLITVGEKGVIVVYNIRAYQPKKLYQTNALAPDADYNRHDDYYALWPMYPITFTEDSSQFAIAMAESPRFVLKLFDTNSGTIAVNLDEIRREGVNDNLGSGGHAIILSKDGKFGAYCGLQGSYGGTEAVWNIAEQKAIAAYLPRYSAGRSGVFSTDNKFYFSSYRQFGFRAYHLESETELIGRLNLPDHKLFRYRGRAYRSGIGWVSEGLRENTFLGQSTENGLRIVEVDYSKLEKAMTDEPVVYPDGLPIDNQGYRKLRFAKRNGTKIKTLTSTQPPNTDEFEEGGLRLSPDKKYLVSHFYSHDGFKTVVGKTVLQVYAVGKWSRPIRSLSRLHPAQVRKMEFSPDGKFFLTISRDKKLRVFQVEGSSKFQHLTTIGSDDNPILNFAVSADSSRIFLIEKEKVTMRNFYEKDSSR